MSSSSSANFSESATIYATIRPSASVLIENAKGTHSVNLLLTQSSTLVLDGDRGRLSSSLVGGRDLHDTANERYISRRAGTQQEANENAPGSINLERNLDLGDSTGRGRDTGELKFAEVVVVAGHGALSLKDLDEDRRLVVGGGREDLGLLGGDDGVAGDELGKDSAGGLDTCVRKDCQLRPVERRKNGTNRG